MTKRSRWRMSCGGRWTCAMYANTGSARIRYRVNREAADTCAFGILAMRSNHFSSEVRRAVPPANGRMTTPKCVAAPAVCICDHGRGIWEIAARARFMMSGRCGVRTTTCVFAGAGASAEAFRKTSKASGTARREATFVVMVPTSSANACTGGTPDAAVDKSSRRGSKATKHRVELSGHPWATPDSMWNGSAIDGAVTMCASLWVYVARAKSPRGGGPLLWSSPR